MQATCRDVCRAYFGHTTAVVASTSHSWWCVNSLIIVNFPTRQLARRDVRWKLLWIYMSRASNTCCWLSWKVVSVGHQQIWRQVMWLDSSVRWLQFTFSELTSLQVGMSAVAMRLWTEMHDVWLQFAERAVQSQPSKTDAEQRARHFKEKYMRRLHELKLNPWYQSSLLLILALTRL